MGGDINVTSTREIPKEAATGGKAESGSRARRNAGRAIAAAGMSIPLFFGGRGLVRGGRAAKLIRQGALKTTDDVDRFISGHLAKVKKVLPKYRWADTGEARKAGKVGIGRIMSEAEAIAENKRIAELNSGLGGFFKWAPVDLPSKSVIPVYTDGKGVARLAADQQLGGSPSGILGRIQRFFARRAMGGGHFNSNLGYVSMGNEGYLNPEVLLHELGHAQDAIDGKLLSSGRSISPKSLKDLWRMFRNPDSTSLLQQEIRAWDNAGIAAGSKLREAALDTYRNAVQSQAAGVASMPLSLGGYALYRSGAGKKPSGGGEGPVKSAAYRLGFMAKCAEHGISPYDAGVLCKISESASDTKRGGGRGTARKAGIAASVAVPTQGLQTEFPEPNRRSTKIVAKRLG